MKLHGGCGLLRVMLLLTFRKPADEGVVVSVADLRNFVRMYCEARQCRIGPYCCNRLCELDLLSLWNWHARVAGLSELIGML